MHLFFNIKTAVPKSTSSAIVTGSGGTGNITVAGAANNMTPAILGQQYIMGQGVHGVFPTYQQMYSYEDLQMMRSLPHMVSPELIRKYIWFMNLTTAVCLVLVQEAGILIVQFVEQMCLL